MSEAESGAWRQPPRGGGGGASPQDTSSKDASSKDASPKDMAASAAQAIKQETASFADEARERAAGKLEEHKQTASETLGDFANAIRKAGDELAQNDQSMAGRMVRQAADGLEGFARSVADKRPEELLDAVRDFGRRNPTAFIAGSVLAGLALGRFLRSSASSAGASGSNPTTHAAGSTSAPGGAPLLANPDLAQSPASNGVAAADAGPEAGDAARIDENVSVLGVPYSDVGDGASGAGSQLGGDVDRERFGSRS